MFLDIRFNTRKNGEKVPFSLLRKSIRKNGKVTHKDFGYLSGLSENTLYAIRDLIRFDQSSQKNINFDIDDNN